jgi:colicin import membrane protein
VTYDQATPREKRISRALAGGMHAAFVLLLVFGVSWQKRHAEPSAVVDLWSALPPPKQEVAPPQPPQREEPKPLPKVEPKPVPKVEAKPPPKPEPKPVPKADIALKEKLEKEHKLKEQQELAKKKERELERRKEDEAKKLKAQQQAETTKKDEEKRKLEKERLAQEAESKRQAAEKQAAADKAAKEAASAQAAEIEKYRRLIQERVKRFIVEPANIQGNPQVVIEVRVIPGGDVVETSVKLKSSSGNPAYDRAVETAIIKASPLPVPSDQAIFSSMFRDPVTLRFRPQQ